jgi:hypothetical protein
MVATLPNRYYLGQEVKVRAQFTKDGVATDPTAVTFQVKAPGGDTVEEYVYLTDVEVIKAGTGDYYLLFTPDDSGSWWYRAVGTGAVATAKEQWFEVLPTEFPVAP